MVQCKLCALQSALLVISVLFYFFATLLPPPTAVAFLHRMEYMYVIVFGLIEVDFNRFFFVLHLLVTHVVIRYMYVMYAIILSLIMFPWNNLSSEAVDFFTLGYMYVTPQIQ